MLKRGAPSGTNALGWALAPVVAGIALVSIASTIAATGPGSSEQTQSLASLLGIPGAVMLLVAAAVAPSWIRGRRLIAGRPGALAFVSSPTPSLDAARREWHGPRAQPLPLLCTVVVSSDGVEIWSGVLRYRLVESLSRATWAGLRGGTVDRGRTGIELAVRRGGGTFAVALPLYGAGPFGMFAISKRRSLAIAAALSSSSAEAD